jgi:serine/threonine protein kinase
MRPEIWREVKTAFDGLRELTPEEARARLVADAGLTPEVREEVASLLRAQDESRGFLETAGGVNLALAQVIPDPLVGASLGAYRIEREIGRGGMGAVYEAVRADAEYEKRVALKVLQAGSATAAILERFRTERQILASLDHPNIARLIDAGTTADGRPYFVMELVDGLAIDEHHRQNNLRCPIASGCSLTVAGVVHHAHQHLVVHRDIKPSNVMVTGEARRNCWTLASRRSSAPPAIEAASRSTPTR